MSVPDYLGRIKRKRDESPTLSLGEASRAVKKEYAQELLNDLTPDYTRIIEIILELI